jgi:hypothetical protein
VITGTANVTLCAAAPFPCAGQTFACPYLQCDSSGVIASPATQITYQAPFKVDAVTGGQTFIYTSGSGGTFFTSTLSKGQFGFSETVGPPPDTATLTVK